MKCNSIKSQTRFCCIAKLFYSHFHEWFISLPVLLVLLLSFFSAICGQQDTIWNVPLFWNFQSYLWNPQCNETHIMLAGAFDSISGQIRVVINLAERERQARHADGQWDRETILNARLYHGLIIHTQSPAIPPARHRPMGNGTISQRLSDWTVIYCDIPQCLSGTGITRQVLYLSAPPFCTLCKWCCRLLLDRSDPPPSVYCTDPVPSAKQCTKQTINLGFIAHCAPSPWFIRDLSPWTWKMSFQFVCLLSKLSKNRRSEEKGSPSWWQISPLEISKRSFSKPFDLTIFIRKTMKFNALRISLGFQ